MSMVCGNFVCVCEHECFLIAALQESEETYPRESGVEVLCPGLQGAWTYALSESHAQR